MKQRASSREWLSPHRSGHRPRLLIEDDRPALAISDFSLFHDAGFDAATPLGPWLLVTVALGLVTFGVYSCCEARWRKVQPG